jgi:hypothetical protein
VVASNRSFSSFRTLLISTSASVARVMKVWGGRSWRLSQM